jgi:hypothetical protein
MGSDENKLLAQLEQEVDDGLAQSEAGKVNAAEAIRTLHEQRLWPEEMNWGEYLLDRFDISEERAKQLIEFIEVHEAILGERRPDRERQARALRKTAKENWQAVWEKACKKSGKKPPPSTLIEMTVKEMTAEKNASRTAPGDATVTPAQPSTDRILDGNKQEQTANSVETTDVPSVAAANTVPPPAKPKEDYYLYVLLTIQGMQDITQVENYLQEQWQAEPWQAKRPNINDEASYGFRFQCPASGVSALMDFISGILDKKMWKVEMEIEKTEGWLMPTSGRLYQPAQVPNRGCGNG